MRFSEVAIGCFVAVTCGGCPGTIEDPSNFDAIGQASTLDAGLDAEVDATVSDAANLDASSDDDASANEEAGPSHDAASQFDASVPAPDAGDAATDAASASDTGIGCDFQALLASKCTKCHDALAVSNGLDLESPDLAQRLAGRSATNNCSSYLLIDPAAPSQSALYLKVTQDACGSRMPLDRRLTDGEQACILRWIESLN